MNRIHVGFQIIQTRCIINVTSVTFNMLYASSLLRSLFLDLGAGEVDVQILSLLQSIFPTLPITADIVDGSVELLADFKGTGNTMWGFRCRKLSIFFSRAPRQASSKYCSSYESTQHLNGAAMCVLTRCPCWHWKHWTFNLFTGNFLCIFPFPLSNHLFK